MRTQINEAEMRAMVEGLKVKNPDIKNEYIVKRVGLNLESEGCGWSEDLERKVMYCIHINPNKTGTNVTAESARALYEK